MKPLKILIGFDEPEFEKNIVKYLKTLGVQPQISVKLTKNSIRDFIQSNPDTDAVVLLEVLNNLQDERMSRFTADELATLTDESDVNVIVLINEDKKGTDFMQILYGAGILSAVFQTSKGGVTAKEVCNLILHKRTRAAAREYYGLREKPVVLDFLGDDTFASYYNYLLDESMNNTMHERFFNLCRWMTDGQIADFLRRLPQENIDEIGEDPEFYDFCGKLESSGIPIHISKPKSKGKRHPDRKQQKRENQEKEEEKVIRENKEKENKYRNSMQIVIIIIAALAIGLITAGVCLNLLL